ncbi:LysR family transcriptional regulator [Desulfosporosinus sp. PR]|uniref:LysR family transcriptional regulator n=1 Tax=Candidatus Desulfosporosinus nitrosoreducens TaxID=3401928 RepID=UPI0027F8E83F|nr:LysR family transcriptional regulator [Desulfosporosinus sp. PR]MDQ7096521.1 LysR family transcriptional regulator [Desulfosporosinus sp. PR]
MKLKYLEEFLMLAKASNYTTAAENIFLSESTLSRHIMSLENELGVKLFHRGSRNISLSEAGTLLVPYAEKVTSAMAEYASLLVVDDALTRQKLTIGFAQSVTDYGIMDYLVRFRRENPDITVLLTENNSESLWRMAKNKECNFSFCYEYAFFDNSGLQLMRLMKDTIVIALPTKHPLAEKERVTLRQLQNENYILPSRNGSAMYKVCMNLFREAGYKPKVLTYTERRYYMLDIVSQGTGITLLDKERFRSYCTPGVQIVNLEPTIEKYLTLIYKKRDLNAAEERFLSFIQDNLSCQ